MRSKNHPELKRKMQWNIDAIECEEIHGQRIDSRGQ